MMRSLFSGVAGLRTHQTRMDVIGNNIANVNTVAYKSSSMTFQDLLYQTTQNASGANAATGRAGINAKQIGLGVATGSISTAIATGGSNEQTGNPFDIKINGSSFFVVNDGSNQYYTRAGAFNVDAEGTLCMSSNGYNVMGYRTTENAMGDVVIDTSQLRTLDIMSERNKVNDPMMTERAYLTGIIDQNDDSLETDKGKVVSFPFYDNLGYSYTAQFSIKPVKDTDGKTVLHQYGITMTDVFNSDGKSILTTNETQVAIPASTVTDVSAKVTGLKDEDIIYKDGDTIGKSTKIQYKDGTDTKYAVQIEGKWYETDEYYKYDAQYTDIASTISGLDAANILEGSKTGPTIKYKDGDDVKYAVMESGSPDKWYAADSSYTKQPDMKTVTGEEHEMSDADKAKLLADVFKAYTLKFDSATGKLSNPATNEQTKRAELRMDLSKLSKYNETFSSVTSHLENAGKGQFIDIDFSNLKDIDNKGTSTANGGRGMLESTEGAGWKVGELSSISIAVDGRIMGSYTNGQTKLLGQIATAAFANASGLEKAGDNLYAQSANSGEAIIGDITADGGSMNTGNLEMSNVDLSQEFTTMITTQRGFQANSRIITVSDTLLEELVNLKR